MFLFFHFQFDTLRGFILANCKNWYAPWFRNNVDTAAHFLSYIAVCQKLFKRINILVCSITTSCAKGQPIKCQPCKMVKHTQTIRRLLPTNYLSVFDYFVGLVLKWLTVQTLLWSVKVLTHLLESLEHGSI